MARPTAFPRWATGGSAAIAAPSEPEKDAGHLPQTILTAQLANWLQNLVYQWIVYLDGATPTAATAPAQVTANTVATIGTDPGAAHADHVHALPTAAPAALAIGSTVVTGTSASLARADHVHAMPTGAAPAALAIGSTVVTGVSTSLARADHVHAMPAAGTPSVLAVGGSNAIGVATTFARSDHQHGLQPFGVSSGQYCEGNDVRIVVLPSTNGHRLAPTVDDSVPADGTFATVYLAPVTSDQIAIYNGTSWVVRQAAAVSYVLAGRTTDLPFDVFAFWTGAVVSLEVLNWTNGTTRATGLTRQNGVLTKTGDATRRYLGTVRPRSATTYQIRRNSGDGSAATTGLDIWNVDNRRSVSVTFRAGASDYTYNTASYRMANGNAQAAIETIAGIAGDSIALTIMTGVSSTDATTTGKATVAVGVNSITQTGVRVAPSVFSALGTVLLAAAHNDALPLGVTAYNWLERGTGLGTNTWLGNTASSTHHPGMSGLVWC